MLYYINVTSWNLLESFVTESISPHIFYSQRSFGNNLSRYLDINNELGNYLILSTRGTKSDYTIQVDESLIDRNELLPIKGYDSLFLYNKTIYFKKNLISVRFSSQELLDSFLAESYILFEVKCVEKYAGSFFVNESLRTPVDVSKKLMGNNLLSFSLSASIKHDNLFNTIKGAILGYVRGAYTATNSQEQSLRLELNNLKNFFTGLNTQIMMSGEAVADPENIASRILLCKSKFNQLRNIKTNFFEVLQQLYQEIISLSQMRADEIAEKKSPKLDSVIHELEKQRRLIEEQIFRVEIESNISEILSELQVIKDQERINGLAIGKSRLYFKAGTLEYERKQYLKCKIDEFKENNSEYKELINSLSSIEQRIAELSSQQGTYDTVIQSIFMRISDIMNDLLKMVTDSEQRNVVDFNDITIDNENLLFVKSNDYSKAEEDYFNTVLSYLVRNTINEPISDHLILNIIAETAKLYKCMPSSTTEDGIYILTCLRNFWQYKNQRIMTFTFPERLPIFQSMMAFYMKPFGYDQIERFILNKHISLKSYAFMLWGACLGYATLPKTFTNIIYQDNEITLTLDDFLTRIEKQIRCQ